MTNNLRVVYMSLSVCNFRMLSFSHVDNTFLREVKDPSRFNL